MATVKVAFVDQTIFLDGRDFVGCTFTNCTLVTFVGQFGLEGPTEYADCKWQFAGPAEGLMRYADRIRSFWMRMRPNPIRLATF